MSRTVHHIFHLHKCARGSRLAEDVLCEHLHILQKSFCLVMFHRLLTDVPYFFLILLFSSASTDNLTLADGNQASHKRYSARRVAVWPFGPLADYNALNTERSPRLVKREARPSLSPPDARILCWLVEFAPHLMNRCEIGSDGKTPLHRLHGRKANTPILEVGEKSPPKQREEHGSHDSTRDYSSAS